jgi:hypothetical protein
MGRSSLHISLYNLFQCRRSVNSELSVTVIIFKNETQSANSKLQFDKSWILGYKITSVIWNYGLLGEGGCNFLAAGGKDKKWMLWEDLHRISRFIIYFSVVVWLLRIVTPEIGSRIWIRKSMSERWKKINYLINFLIKLKWVLMQEHSKLYCTFLETGMYLIYFFDLMQIGTQTQLFLSIDTQIFDNCANKQKDNRMNKSQTTTLK